MRTLTPLATLGLLLALASFGCEAKNPVGPGSVSVSELITTTTTTSVIPGRRYVAFQAPLNVPSDMTLFFQLLSSGVGQTGTYGVVGVHRTGNNTGGAVQGQVTGSPDNGQFNGTLTVELPGCVAERDFSGQLTEQLLQWTAGTTRRDCPGSPLAFPAFTLLRSDAPPPTTTMVPTTSSTTTSISPIRPPNFVMSPPSGPGLMAATVFGFRYEEAPSGGVPPFVYSWNFGDGSPPAAGMATSHVFGNTGTFTVVATVRDSSGLSDVAQTTVGVRSVTGLWKVVINTANAGAIGAAPGFTLTLSQVQAQVTATVNDPSLVQERPGVGSVANPRDLSVIGLEVRRVADVAPVRLSFVGSLTSSLNGWSGSVTGLPGCPCEFTATR